MHNLNICALGQNCEARILCKCGSQSWFQNTVTRLSAFRVCNENFVVTNLVAKAVQTILHTTQLFISPPKLVKLFNRVPTAVDQQNSMIFPGFQSFFQVYFFVFFLVGFVYPFSKTNKVKYSIILQKKCLAKKIIFFQRNLQIDVFTYSINFE